MEKNVDSKTLLQILNVIVWIIFIGLCIEAGGIIVNFVFSIFKPEIVGHLYQKLDMSDIYRRSKWAFFGMYSFLLMTSILKAILFYNVIQLLYKLDLSSPFNSFVAKKISQISTDTLSIGIFSFIAREASRNLSHRGYEIEQLNHFWEGSLAFILMAAVIYIIATIFKKGIELQNESDLTV
jgi:Protein of unknown function (DUF2975)